MTIKKSRTLLLAENIVLETERLILRPLTLEDAADVFEYVSDEETMEHIFEPHTSLQQTQEFIANYYVSSPLGFYAMEHKANRKMIGAIEFRINDQTHQGEIGYMLNKNYWRQGLTTEACFAILSLGFDTLLLDKIISGHDTGHDASGNVLKKIGMTFDYIMKDSHQFKGQMVDTTFYVITRETYLANQQA